MILYPNAERKKIKLRSTDEELQAAKLRSQDSRCQVEHMRDQLVEMRFVEIELEGNVIRARTQCDSRLTWDVRTGKPVT